MEGLYQGPYGGPREVGVSYERGTPVARGKTGRVGRQALCRLLTVLLTVCYAASKQTRACLFQP